MKAKSTLALLGLLPALLAAAASAGEPDAVKRLHDAKSFAFGGVGIAGIVTGEEIAFREIFATPTAEADFAKLLKTGTSAAQCYALVGLRLKNRAVFEESVKPFTTEKTEVETIGGCIIMKLPMSSVAAQIKTGTYDQQAQREMKPRRPAGNN